MDNADNNSFSNYQILTVAIAIIGFIGSIIAAGFSFYFSWRSKKSADLSNDLAKNANSINMELLSIQKANHERELRREENDAMSKTKANITAMESFPSGSCWLICVKNAGPANAINVSVKIDGEHPSRLSSFVEGDKRCKMMILERLNYNDQINYRIANNCAKKELKVDVSWMNENGSQGDGFSRIIFNKHNFR